MKKQTWYKEKTYRASMAIIGAIGIVFTVGISIVDGDVFTIGVIATPSALAFVTLVTWFMNKIKWQ